MTQVLPYVPTLPLECVGKEVNANRQASRAMAKGIFRMCGSATRCQIANLVVRDGGEVGWHNQEIASGRTWLA